MKNYKVNHFNVNKSGQYILTLLFLCLGVCFTGCTGDDDMDMSSSNGSSDFYIRLNISTRKTTPMRALPAEYPWGGEDGDNDRREDGRNNEDLISDFTIFIYNDAEGNGINDAPNTDIKCAKYFKYQDLEYIGSNTYQTKPLKITNYAPDEKDRIIVVANMGDMSSLTTLGAVRNAEISKGWTAASAIKDYKDFAMSSATDNNVSPNYYGKVVTSHEGTYEDPLQAETQIERIAARIDFWMMNPLTTGEDYVEYEVANPDLKSDVLRLSHVRIVNASQMPTYNIKRVADAVKPLSSTVNYLGLEEVDGSSHIPTNYVVEPLTTTKNSTSVVSTSMLDTWYGASSFNNSRDVAFLDNDDYKIATHSSEQFTLTGTDSDMDGDGNDDVCYTLGYTMENTMDITGQTSKFMTGLELKGTYVPHEDHVMKLSGGSPVKDGSYTAGSDFWYYVNTLGTVKIIFSNETDANIYKAVNPGTVNKYTKGECYYYVWIRHAMYDGSHTTGTFPMEYGIVRNNIYRIGVQGVEGLGTYVPSPDPVLLKSSLYVRKWRFREHPEIVL